MIWLFRAYPNNPLYCGRLQSPMPALSAKNVLDVEKPCLRAFLACRLGLELFARPHNDPAIRISSYYWSWDSSLRSEWQLFEQIPRQARDDRGRNQNATPRRRYESRVLEFRIHLIRTTHETSRHFSLVRAVFSWVFVVFGVDFWAGYIFF